MQACETCQETFGPLCPECGHSGSPKIAKRNFRSRDSLILVQ